MTDNIESAAEVIGRYVHQDFAEDAARDLAAEGHLTPAPQVIRTVEELEALDPDTALGVWNPALDMGCIFLTAGELVREPADPRIRWAVIAPAEQVRAARKALEEA